MFKDVGNVWKRKTCKIGMKKKKKTKERKNKERAKAAIVTPVMVVVLLMMVIGWKITDTTLVIIVWNSVV